MKTLFPLLLRYAPLLHGLFRRYRSARSSQRYEQQASVRQSEVETRYLRMTLDHDSGAMHGVVLVGVFKGRALESMSAEQLLNLLDECRHHDEESVALLEAFLDRQYGEDWRQHDDRDESDPGGSGSSDNGNRSGAMCVDEAYEILGLSPGASSEQIVEAHRRLIQKL
ncbi:MAG: J domain-containing protein, partial [Gammaproteobacteria bacterium]|nr:J domain-containing protein [Gammaproteobacteria bacterium]